MSDWIPTSERMPEEYQPVIVAWRSGETLRMAIGVRTTDGRWGVDGLAHPVTHWPLPKHPDADAGGTTR